ncbi:transcription factor bHLH112-like [Cornus florida]|uniref:transcription factor bHLH112-like n=1 Tax=Cornus florida TaxID=4283 RepID=UPI0028A1250F|nr:transcription factor bHLH112-like [Cornus florida]
MADEFQAGVYGGNWWNNSWKSTLGSSPCSTVINDMGSLGWATDLVAVKAARSSDESIAFQDLQKPQPSHEYSIDGGGTVVIDSTVQMMGIGLPSSATMDWNHTLLSGTGRAENNIYHHHPLLQEDMNSRLNYKQTGIDCPQDQDSTMSTYKPMNQGLSLNEPSLNCVTTSGSDCTPTCQGLPTSFSVSSTSYDYPSTLLHSLFDTTDPQPQASIFDKPLITNPSTTNYRTNLDDNFSPTMPKFSSLLKPSQPTSHLHFNNDTPFWNATAAHLNDIRASFFPSMQSQFLGSTFEDKPNCLNSTPKPNNIEVRDSSSVAKKNGNIEPVFKRQRIETPSPLPTFKVRKEKLGDRITALQQLVSPFGKTDTASVLHESIEYIKFLHHEVSVLSTPYLKNGAPIRHQQTCDKLKEQEGPTQDLKSRGLCLVPISSTFPVANEPTSDLWTPTFGGIFR